jgi:ZIP family zinc transporter
MPITEVVFWGFISVTGIILGSVIGLKFNLQHSLISKIVAIASGLLVATATVELFHNAIDDINLYVGILALFAGALAFSFANSIVSGLGAKNRKRCGVCVEQPTEEANPGSGLAIMIGTAMDAIPEAMVLGLTLKTMGVDYALILAIALGNLPEAISSSSGMKEAGRSHRWIFTLWGLVSVGTILLTVLGFILAEHLSHEVIAILELFGAGALLSLVAETLIPEATHGTPKFAGLLIVLGFILLLLF